MAAAARCEGFAIAYGGVAQYDYAPVVGRAFVRAVGAAADGAVVANFPGVRASMAEVVAAIDAAAPEAAGRITWEEAPLPFPAELEARALEETLGPLPRASLAEGLGQPLSGSAARASDGPARGAYR